jgi:hypothetical protein
MPSVSLPTATLALGVAGAATSAVGAISAGASNAAQANYQAQVAANNTKIAQQNRDYAIQAGQTATTTEGLKERSQAAATTAGLAASGLDVNTGSARAVRTSQAEIGEQNVEQTSANALLTAYGYQTSATGYEAETTLQKAAAPRDIEAGTLSGLGALASGASNVGFKWSGLTNPPTGAVGSNAGL